MSYLPPDSDPTPAWARSAVSRANSANKAVGSASIFLLDDLIHIWRDCGGRCKVSGLPFDSRVIGNGKARHPFAPSLDRIDPAQRYTRENVRLVVGIANFGMNAWGLAPLHELASAIHRLHGDCPAFTGVVPAAGELDAVAVIDDEYIETDQGIVGFPPRPDIQQAILSILLAGPASSRQLEDEIATRFGVTPKMRTAMATGRYPVWRNQVAWALVGLGAGKTGTGEIGRVETLRAPDGGTMGLYRLSAAAPPG